MGLFEHFPYVNMHELNLDWIVDFVKKTKDKTEAIDDAVSAAEDAAADSAAKALESEGQALISEAWAVGRKNNVPVSVTAPQYENHSKYWADQSFESATQSQISAENSAASEASAKNYADNIADPVSGIVSGWLEDNITNPSSPPIDKSLLVENAAADAKVTGDNIRILEEAAENADIDIKPISIPISMELGGMDLSGVDTSDNTRARTANHSMACSAGCPVYTFDDGTKHRFCFMTRFNQFIAMTDWSTSTSDSIVDYLTDAIYPNGIWLRILVGYVDNRTINSTNIPNVSIEYKLSKRIPISEGFAIDTNPGAMYKNMTTQFGVSPFIPVEYNKTYRVTSARNMIFLDSELLSISYIRGSDQNTGFTFTIDDANIKYVAYCFHTYAGTQYFDEVDSFIGGYIGDDSVPYTLAGKKMSLLGDSISAYNGTIPVGNDAYYTGNNAGVSDFANMWWSVLCTRTGMLPLIIDGYSGSGVTQLEDAQHIAKVPMSSDARCGALHSGGTNPDIIIIAGGLNDYSYALSAQSEPLSWNGKTSPVLGNSFTEAYACMIKKLQTNYPDAIIVALSTWFTMRGSDNGYTLTHSVNGHIYTQADYDAAIENVCKIMHIPFIRVDDIGINRNNMYPTFAQDSPTEPTHPNANGHKLMGEAIATKLPIAINGYCKTI